MLDRFRRREAPREVVEAQEEKEGEEVGFEKLRGRAKELFRSFMERLGSNDAIETQEYAEQLAAEFEGVETENVTLVTAEMVGVGSSAEISTDSAVEPVVRRGETRESTYSVALTALLVSGCSFAPEKMEQPVETAPTPVEVEPDDEEVISVPVKKTVVRSEDGTESDTNPLRLDDPLEDTYSRIDWVSGSEFLSDGKYGVAEQPEPAPDESHRHEFPDGPLTPEHAPTGYGMHQWKGYSEYNPVAVAWLAIKNTGDKPCKVEVTRLELSYKMPDGTAVMGSSRINGIERLADGTRGTYWGQPLGHLFKGSIFEIPPGTPDYVHPYGTPVEIPEEAEQVTVTFSAEITEGCVVGGGMDTYSDTGRPRTTDGYTQDGSTTDFIKEAVKMPWVGETVPPEKPMSYAIVHKKTSEKEPDGAEPTDN